MKTAGKLVRFASLTRRDLRSVQADSASPPTPTEHRGNNTPPSLKPCNIIKNSEQRKSPPACPENAGSPVERELCPMSTLSCGYLNKLSTGDAWLVRQRWKRRWFKFDYNFRMLYWRTEEEAQANPSKPIGEIDLSQCSTKEEKVQERRFVFCIVTAQANIYLEAASHEEMLGWMSSIDEAKMRLAEKENETQKKARVSSMIRSEKRHGDLMMLVEAKNEDEDDRWEKRHFVLKQNNFLCFYLSKEDRNLAGPPIDLLICTIQEVPGETWCFEILEGRTVFWLMAQSELEMCSWISSLRNAITLAQAAVFHDRLLKKAQFHSSHIERSGWLKKLKPKGWGWNRRWFVLQGEELVYYRSPTEKAQRGSISVLFVKARHCSDKNAFELLTSLRKYVFETESEADANAWIKAIEDLNQMLIKTQLRDPLEGRRTMQLQLMDVQKALS